MSKKITKIGFIVVSMLAALLILESGSFFLQDYALRSSLRHSSFAPYHKGNPADRTDYALIPCYESSYREMFKVKESNGHWLWVQRMQGWMDDYGYGPDDVYLYINSHGFRGSEIAVEKTPDKHRIMTIGDSCTFGVMQNMTYSHVLEEELSDSGLNIEVINAGVEGYTPYNVLKRLDYFMRFKPDIVTIYLGWNTLVKDWRGIKSNFVNNLSSVKLLKMMYLRTTYRNAKCIMPGELEGKYYEKTNWDYEPSFMSDFEHLIDRLNSLNVEVILLTLPSLFELDEEPDADTLKMGHLSCYYAGNAYLHALCTYKFNEALRGISRTQKIPLIDLEEYSDTYMKPKKQYFVDSVHLTPKGQRDLGKYLAREIINSGIMAQPIQGQRRGSVTAEIGARVE